MNAGKMKEKYILWSLCDLKKILIIGKLTALSGDRKEKDKIILKITKWK